ncbi:hypothetical protein DYB28_002453 [Aphanomyces astaci]|uniref:Uncharacterized protein n=1 Tax=Aphanomyces astaci TaxID=112090 RepID=A0A9X8DRR2_APHAT|nr:hypothetical protein DYB28_002453 [Aphanomyces astaci]
MPRVPTGRELTDDQRLAVYHRLLQLKTNGRVSQGQMKLLMHECKVSQQTISRISIRGCDSAASTGCAKVLSRKKGRCGASRKYATTDVRTIITSTQTAGLSTFRLDLMEQIHDVGRLVTIDAALESVLQEFQWLLYLLAEPLALQKIPLG